MKAIVDYYDESKGELVCHISGTKERVIVDPFVGVAYDQNDAESLINKTIEFSDDTLFTKGAYCPRSIFVL